MIIDCDGCGARGPACHDCVVSVLLGVPGSAGDLDQLGAGRRVHAPVLVSGPALAVRPSVPLDLDAAERAAIAVLAGSGLVPPLRMVPAPATGRDAGNGPAGPPGAGVADSRPA